MCWNWPGHRFKEFIDRRLPAGVMHVIPRRTLSLQGRTVLITGAGSGIGAAIAQAVGVRGASVALVDVHQDDVDEVSAALGSRGLAIAADVTDTEQIGRAVDTAVDHFGSLDVCIANAGIAARTPTTIAETSYEEFERIIEVDLLGVWRTVRACLPHIAATRGHVLVTSSIYAFINGAANAPYAMSKAAVESFGRSLRAELAGSGATAGVLYPGWVDTPIIAASHQDESASQQLLDLLIPGALNTPVAPEVVARAVVHGVEHRRARIVVPRRWAPVAAFRGIVNIATDTLIDRHPRVHQLLNQL